MKEGQTNLSEPFLGSRPGTTGISTISALLCAVVFWVAQFFAPGPTAATEIFVARATDNDSGGSANGDLGSPYASLAEALAAAAKGDTISLREGTYAGGVAINTPDLTLQSHRGERAVVSSPTNDSGIPNTIWVNATGTTIRNLEIQGGYLYALKFERGDALVSHSRIHGSGRDAVKIVPHADNITIEDCEIYASGLRDPSNAEGIDNVNGDNMVVRRTQIHDTATSCAYAKGGAIGAVFERLLLMNCGHAGIILGQSSDTEFLDPNQNPTYKESIDGVVRNCIIVNTNGAGVSMQAALRPTVVNNTLVNVAESTNAGIYFASTAHLGENRATEDATVVNNIVVQTAVSSRPMVFITASGLTGTLTMDNNRYHKVAGNPVFWDQRVPAFNWSLPQWNGALGVDGSSSVGDPQLDASFHLSEAGPCVGAGQAIEFVSDDYDGDPRTAPYDIGADQHPAGPPSFVPPSPPVLLD